MTCHMFAETIVDVARGRDVGAGTAAAVESHLERCAACRARFTRERRLSEGLRALAASVEAQGAPEQLEARLLDAFAAQHSTAAVRPVASKHTWMQLAAAVIVVAGAFAVWKVSRAPRVDSAPSVAQVPSPSPIAQAVEPASVATAVNEQPRASKPVAHRPRPSRIVRAEGFVPLPSAAGLPDFESGEIVRVDLPVTSLPIYGIEIAPDARGSTIKADFLIGQDRLVRAIRLVPSGRPSAVAHVE
jgi:anti-sigma factor RsiW